MDKRDRQMVCIVDDDASLRRSLENLLMSLGFRVQTFPSAEAFLESDHRDSIGCVVLDVRMTGMSGAVAFLDKPVRSSTLIEAVRAALRR